MLSFPEWLKPIRRHSATSLMSGSSLVAQSGTNKDLRYGVYPNFQSAAVTPYNSPSNDINQFNLVGSSSDIKSISNKPSKSAWGRVRRTHSNFSRFIRIFCSPKDYVIKDSKFDLGKKDDLYTKRVTEERVWKKRV